MGDRSRALLRDRPHVVNGVLVLLVLAHAGAAVKWPRVDLLGTLGRSDDDQGSASDLFLAAAGLASMVAGFAGVVIIFGLQSQSERFRTFRLLGGAWLRSNWSALIGTPFVAAFLSIACALALDLGHPGAAAWMFELVVLLLMHTAIRQTWLLGWLARIVLGDDESEARKARTVSVDSLLSRRPRS